MRGMQTFYLRKMSWYVSFSFCLLVGPVMAQLKVTPTDTLPAKPGEHCTVCGVLLTAEDVALIVRGRRVPLNKAMVNTFMDDPEKYFAMLQPRSALFQEELTPRAEVAQGGISLGWFLFGLYMLVALVFAGMSAYTAVSNGLTPIPHFFVGLFFNIFGYLYVLTRPAVVEKRAIPAGLVKVPATNAPVPCPLCGYANHPSASKCTGCGGKLEPLMESEVTRVM